jgi:ubiquinone/menaquinone biosynthesis C-methylase UbiE
MKQPERELKGQVKDFWERQSCDTDQAKSSKFSREYFEEIENWRYADQPFIHSFAQFTRYRGKRVVEVGFGAGTDFIQWLRAGARASGVDLTQEALDNLRHRIEIYGLPSPEKIEVADAENLPFPSDQFDLGYSFGVLHHSPDTPKAISELVRVVRPGGQMKIMLYNRRSIWTFNLWAKHALLRGQPWKSFHWALWNHMESIGTKGYTKSEIQQMLAKLPLRDVSIKTETTTIDHVIAARAFSILNPFYRLLVRLTDKKLGFFHCITATKTGAAGPPRGGTLR